MAAGNPEYLKCSDAFRLTMAQLAGELSSNTLRAHLYLCEACKTDALALAIAHDIENNGGN